jgi:hypothetical protein
LQAKNRITFVNFVKKVFYDPKRLIKCQYYDLNDDLPKNICSNGQNKFGAKKKVEPPD